ncbi:MAG TPA: hypothetical protein VKB79_13480 [Bryobacteraceae bacterium]|nr:hypothetical protein [Bryobacteraceae bacterium]
MLRRFFLIENQFVAKARTSVAKGVTLRDTLVAVVVKIPLRGLLVAGFSLVALLIGPDAARAQVIEYESNGMKYQTETRKGLTVIVTHLPSHIAGFGLLQVSIANGSQIYWNVKPEGFSYVHADATFNALPANQVVDMLLDKASHTDVIKLVSSYENALYGIPHMRSTNGYETRRQNAMSYGMPTRLKAAATASAIVLATTRLAAGQSTDGAVFIPLTRETKNLNGGHVVFRCGDEVFDFNPD